MHADGGEKRLHQAGGAQSVAEQRAAPWTQLDQPQRCGLAHALPGRDGPQADDLAEHLADLGRRYEVTIGA